MSNNRELNKLCCFYKRCTKKLKLMLYKYICYITIFIVIERGSWHLVEVKYKQVQSGMYSI